MTNGGNEDFFLILVLIYYYVLLFMEYYTINQFSPFSHLPVISHRSVSGRYILVFRLIFSI